MLDKLISLSTDKPLMIGAFVALAMGHLVLAGALWIGHHLLMKEMK